MELRYETKWPLLVCNSVTHPSVPFLLAIVLSVLRFTNSDYPIAIFKLFIHYEIFSKTTLNVVQICSCKSSYHTITTTTTLGHFDDVLFREFFVVTRVGFVFTKLLFVCSYNKISISKLARMIFMKQSYLPFCLEKTKYVSKFCSSITIKNTAFHL